MYLWMRQYQLDLCTHVLMLFSFCDKALKGIIFKSDVHILSDFLHAIKLKITYMIH